MSTAFCAGTDIRKIVESLPVEEIEHMHRVGILVSIMSAKISSFSSFSRNFNMDEYKYFGEAASFHDIGKAWVPKNLLMKPDQLTDEEAAMINKHPVFARILFERINNGFITGMQKYLFKLIFESSVYHHEWWNGKGYPYGISSENIPLIARITSVCDAYDAITSNRVYRKARTHHYACSELEANAGTQFDPALVQVFLDNEREISVLINKMISCL